MSFIWDVSEKQYQELLCMNSSRTEYKNWPDYPAEFFGCLHVGKVCLDFMHTRDYENWTPYGDVFLLGIDTEYAYTANGEPYANLMSVDIKLQPSLEQFKASVEKQFIELCERNELLAKQAAINTVKW